MRLLFRKFSTPGRVPSHCGPHVPNSMHEGGELGYSLVHAFGAAFDNPELIVARVIGDGESETCLLEGSWKSVNFLNPVRDGAVLPIMHLNGYKIPGPTVQGRTGDEALKALYMGRGYKPYFVEGDDPEVVHQLLAGTLDDCYAEIRAIQQEARQSGFKEQPIWPMIVMRTPKGWTCPKEADGIPIEGMDEALEHCSRGASTWQFATNDGGGEPDVVLACAGDVPTIEICAASWLLQKYVPGIKVRVVNVVDLSVFMMPDDHPHGMDNMSFNALFTKDAHVIFAFHNNRWLIHTMVHGRSNESRFHVRGYMDQGTTTTPFDMVVLNQMSRFHLAIDALKYVPRLRSQTSDIVDVFNRKLYEHHDYIRQHLEDMPEIRNWRWTADFNEPSAPPPLAKVHPRANMFSDS